VKVAAQACHFFKNGGAQTGIVARAVKTAKVNFWGKVMVRPANLTLKLKVGDIA
jgi:hypothetical protein